MAAPLAQGFGAEHCAMSAERMLGIPEVCTQHPGVDAMGNDCRLDPTVTVMRWGARR